MIASLKKASKKILIPKKEFLIMPDIQYLIVGLSVKH